MRAGGDGRRASPPLGVGTEPCRAERPGPPQARNRSTKVACATPALRDRQGRPWPTIRCCASPSATLAQHDGSALSLAHLHGDLVGSSDQKAPAWAPLRAVARTPPSAWGTLARASRRAPTRRSARARGRRGRTARWRSLFRPAAGSGDWLRAEGGGGGPGKPSAGGRPARSAAPESQLSRRRAQHSSRASRPAGWAAGAADVALRRGGTRSALHNRFVTESLLYKGFRHAPPPRRTDPRRGAPRHECGARRAAATPATARRSTSAPCISASTR